MISRTSLTILAFAVCLLVSGCFRALVVMDGLPDNLPKGHAAFTASWYTGKCGNLVLNVPVHEVINGDNKNVRYVGNVTTNPDVEPFTSKLLRVAALPGPHTYRVTIGSITRDQVVNIETGRVTPVNIDIECTSVRTQNYSGGRSVYYYGDFKMKTGASVSLEVWKNRFSRKKIEDIKW